jgi:hypothetical protein
MPSPTGAERAKATKLRTWAEAGRTLDPDDAEWLKGYEQERIRVKEARGRSARKSHTVEYRETSDEAAAEGEGDGLTAAVAAQAAAMVREEGRREDNLARLGIEALIRSAEMNRNLTESFLKRQESLEKTLLTMMHGWRGEFIGRAQLEADQIVKDAQHEAEKAADEKKDPLSEMAEMLMPLIMAKLGGGLPPNVKP